MQNLNVHDNAVDVSARGQTGIAQAIGDNSVFTSGNNRIANNGIPGTWRWPRCRAAALYTSPDVENTHATLRPRGRAEIPPGRRALMRS